MFYKSDARVLNKIKNASNRYNNHIIYQSIFSFSSPLGEIEGAKNKT